MQVVTTNQTATSNTGTSSDTADPQQTQEGDNMDHIRLEAEIFVGS
jgi:hypothetical protein